MNFHIHSWKVVASYRCQIKITILQDLLQHSAQLPDTDNCTHCFETPLLTAPKARPPRRQKLNCPVSPNTGNFTGNSMFSAPLTIVGLLVLNQKPEYLYRYPCRYLGEICSADTEPVQAPIPNQAWPNRSTGAKKPLNEVWSTPRYEFLSKL